MTKKEKLMNGFNRLKEQGKDIVCIALFIHMPTGETEYIVNPLVDEKISYIDKVYNDDLIHTNCKDIRIKDWIFSLKNETGYTFGQALDEIRVTGQGMRLPNWSEDVVIRVQKPDEHSKMTAPYLYVESRFGRVPWKETMIELFADNWEIVD